VILRTLSLRGQWVWLTCWLVVAGIAVPRLANAHDIPVTVLLRIFIKPAVLKVLKLPNVPVSDVDKASLGLKCTFTPPPTNPLIPLADTSYVPVMSCTV